MLRSIVLSSASDDAPDLDQAALIREMLAGSRRAWRAFHARYDRLILRSIARVTRFQGSGDEVREIRATLLSQLCANDMSKLRSFDADKGSKLGTFIARLATNCAIDCLRAASGGIVCEALADEDAEALVDEAPTPHEALERKERMALAAEMLHELTDKERELFVLYFGEGLDPEQIAARMSISVNTVYSKKHKIQSRLLARVAAPRLSLAA